MAVAGYIDGYRIYHFDTPFRYNKNSYWITLQFCWALVSVCRFQKNYKADFRGMKGYAQPSPFGRNWKGWFGEFAGISIMFKKEIK